MKHLILGTDHRSVALRIVVLIVATWIVFGICVQHIRLYGISMEPTLHAGEIRFVNKLAYRQKPPQRGDIVAARFKDSDRVLLLKRVIARPGETVAIRNGVVWIDGVGLDEPYLHPDRDPWQVREVQMGPTEYFLIGDNRSMGPERHAFGIVDRSQIIGKLIE